MLLPHTPVSRTDTYCVAIWIEDMNTVKAKYDSVQSENQDLHELALSHSKRADDLEILLKMQEQASIDKFAQFETTANTAYDEVCEAKANEQKRADDFKALNDSLMADNFNLKDERILNTSNFYNTLNDYIDKLQQDQPIMMSFDNNAQSDDILLRILVFGKEL